MNDRWIPNEPQRPAPFHAVEANHRILGQSTVPPNNPEAERALLGTMLLKPSAIDEAAKIVGADDFYRPAHVLVFEALVTLRESGVVKPDPTVVADYLLRAGTLEQVGGGSFLTDLQGDTPNTTNADLYATAIAGYAARRRLMAIGATVSDAARDNDLLGASLAIDRASDLLGRASGVLTSPWDRIDLSAVGETSILPGFWWRTDGVGLVYPAAINSFLGASESFKSFGAIAAAQQTLDGGSTVLYVDWEDNPARMVHRMELVGIDVLGYWAKGSLAYIRPDAPPTAKVIADLASGLWGLVVIDGVTEAMSASGLSLLDNDEVAKFYGHQARPFAAAGSAVVLIDHIPKVSENGPVGAIGGQHKRAGIDGASLLFSVAMAPSADTQGIVNITVDKDRHYGLREHASGKRIGTMRLTPKEGGGLHITVEKPGLPYTPRPGPAHLEQTGPRKLPFIPTVIMGQLIEAVEALNAMGLPATSTRLDDRVRSKVKNQALDLLIAGGYLTVHREGASVIHSLGKPIDLEALEREHETRPPRTFDGWAPAYTAMAAIRESDDEPEPIEVDNEPDEKLDEP